MKELLRTEMFEKAYVLNTPINKEKIEVSGVSLWDPEISEYNQGNILFIPHGWVPKDGPSLLRLCKMCVENEMSAVVMPAGPSNIHDESVLVKAAENGLYWLEMTIDGNLAEIMAEVYFHIKPSSFEQMHYYREVHDLFMMHIIDGKGLETIVHSIEELLENPVAIFDIDDYCIYAHPLVREIYQRVTKESRMHRLNILYYYEQEVILNDQQRVIEILFPIRLGKNIKAYMSIFEINRPLNKKDYITLEVAATAVILEMKKRFAVGEVEQKYKNDLVHDLIFGEMLSEEAVAERGDMIGLHLRQPHVVALFHIKDLNKLYVQQFSPEELLYQNRMSEISGLLKKILSEYTSKIFISSLSDHIIVFWPVGEFSYKELVQIIKKAGSQFQKRLKEKEQSLTVTIGFGKIANDISQYSRSYREALDAVNHGKSVYGEGCILGFEELGVFHLLCQFENRSVLSEFIPESLWQLKDYDEKNQTDLLPTLNIYLQCNGNASKAAKQLYIHYKTILYRINKMNEICRINLEDPEIRLQIQLGLKILHLV